MVNGGYAQTELAAIESMVESKKSAVERGERIRLQDLLPEFEVKNPCILWRRRADFIPLPYLFAFCRQVILPIEFVSRDVFRKQYGLDLDTVLKLIQDERIIPVFMHWPISAYDQESSRLKPILQCTHVPNLFVRSWRLLNDARNLRAYDERKEYLDWTRKLVSKFTQEGSDVFRIVKEEILEPSAVLGTRRIADLTPMDYTSFVSLVTARAVMLSRVLYGNVILENILALDKPSTAFVVLYLMSMNHDTCAATCDAIPMLSSDQLQILRVIYGRMVVPSTIVSASKFLLGKLNVKLGYQHPEGLTVPETLKFIEKLDEKGVIDQNLKLLLSFQRYLEDGRFDEAVTEAARFSEAWTAVQMEVKDIARTNKWVKYLIYPGFAIISGAFASSVASSLSGYATQMSFPVFAAGSSLVAYSSETIKSQLDGLATFLTGRIYGRSSAPFLMWNRVRAKRLS